MPPVLGAALLVAGCSSGVKGTYLGGDDSLMQSMTFKSGGKVDIVLANGIGGEGTFEVDGDKIRVSANGTTNELTIGKDDCLHGPLMLGTLCKGGGKPAANAGVGSDAQGTGNLAGSRFESPAPDGGGKMVIEFTDGRTIKISAVVPGESEGNGAAVGTYSTIGDQVVISVQGSPETFTLKGNTLIGSFGGEEVRFTRR